MEASNHYLEEISYQDELLINVIDFFTEKWSYHGKAKPFSYKNEKYIEIMMKTFPHIIDEKTNEIVFQSHRMTSSQKLIELLKKEKIIINMRKLNEFIDVINKIDSKQIASNLMKEYLYNFNNKNEEENFLKILEKYSFDYKIFSDETSDIPNYTLAAAYFNHNDILKWLLKNFNFDINSKNARSETILHFGKYKLLFSVENEIVSNILFSSV